MFAWKSLKILNNNFHENLCIQHIRKETMGLGGAVVSGV